MSLAAADEASLVVLTLDAPSCMDRSNFPWPYSRIIRQNKPHIDAHVSCGYTTFQTSAMAKELDAVHEELEDREAQMAALTKALSEAGVGLR